MRLVVTGATGYIGKRLVDAALRRGWEVIAATRSAPHDRRVEWRRYALEEALALRALPERATVLHLAADTRSSEVDADVELRAVRELLAAAAASASSVVLLSSQAAGSDAPTAYGRAKWHAEREVLAAGGTVVRAGLVYGGEARGVFGKLSAAVERLPLLPALVPVPIVQPIHVDDLAEALCRIVERADVQVREWSLGAETPVPFTAFLRSLARHRLRRRRLFLPVPAMVVRAADRRSLAWLRDRIDLGRLRSLMSVRPMSTNASLARLGVALRPLDEGMQRSGRLGRRRLASEGRTLIAYALRERAPFGCVARYVRAIETLRGGTPLELPSLVTRHPSLVALIEQGAASGPMAKELAWRIDAATLLAEASTSGARRYLALGETERVASALRVTRALVSEIALRMLRPAVRPWLERTLHAGR